MKFRMIAIIDRSERDWATVDWETNEVVYDESQIRKPLTTSDCMFVAGKYSGSLLSEIADTWYLKFIRDKNQNDYFINVMFGRRLKELE